jgi:hypothetical protein
MCVARCETHCKEQNVMSTQDPFGSAVPPERPRDPTHFGGEGLYDNENEGSLKVPLDEQLDSATKQSLGGETDERSGRSQSDAVWDFARRNHVPAVLAVGGVAVLLGMLIRRSTRG